MKAMQEIIEAVDRSLIEKELTPERFVRRTNSGGNDIYIVTYQNSPNVTREIGRLREITFRDAGGGTGLDCDLDEFDVDGIVFHQQNAFGHGCLSVSRLSTTIDKCHVFAEFPGDPAVRPAPGAHPVQCPAGGRACGLRGNHCPL